MRLNGRGLANIWEHEENKGLDIDCYEFQPSDFDEGIVMLSVEEAKVIANALLTYERLFKGAINASSNSEQNSLPLSCNLQKRIEQSEGKQ